MKTAPPKIKPMIKVSFSNRMEIRMGSPYNVCRVRLKGEWIPDLPETDWQDKAAQSDDGRYLALVRWHVPGNVPGFCGYIIDAKKQTLKKSRPRQGCCQSLTWKKDGFSDKAFPDRSGKIKV